MLTQLARSSEQRKIHIETASMVIRPRFEQTGSIGADTIASKLVDVETRLDIESSASEEDLKKLIRTSERMCFLMDVIRNPHEVSNTVTLNGAELS